MILKSLQSVLLISLMLVYGRETKAISDGKWPDSKPIFEAENTTVSGHLDGVPVKDMYQCFREPVVVKTKSGRLVVGCHAGNKLEWPERSGQDFVIRYSDDGGKNWSTSILAAEHGHYSFQSHGMVYDAVIDRIIVKYMVYRWDYSKVEGRGLEASATVIRNVLEEGEDYSRQYMIYSDDGAETWSKPMEIPVEKKHDIPHYGSSEGRQLTIGKYKDRLIIPGGTRVEEMGEVIRKAIGIWYSDDHGNSWKFVNITTDKPRRISCEARVTELEDGSLLYNVRTRYDGRCLARSTDGGETWSELEARQDLEVTQCNGSMITLLDKKGKLTSDLAFSIPSPGGRSDGLIYISRDGGKNWPIKHQPVDGYFAYSALIQANPETVLLFYESNHYKDIRVIRIPVSRLIKE